MCKPEGAAKYFPKRLGKGWCDDDDADVDKPRWSEQEHDDTDEADACNDDDDSK